MSPVQHQADLDRLNLAAYENRKVVKAYVDPADLQKPEAVLLQRLMPHIRGTRIMDLGVGGGRTTPHLLRPSEDYIGLDYSAAMIEVCRKKFPDVHFLHRDVRNLADFPDDEFGFIMFSFNGIDHVSPEERRQVLREICRILQPGGFFVFSSHNRDYLTGKHPLLRVLPPVRMMKYLVWYAWSRLRHRGLEQHTEDYALVNDPGHNFRFLTYYVSPEKQVQQLREAGFRPGICILNLEGKAVERDPASAWLTYCAQK